MTSPRKNKSLNPSGPRPHAGGCHCGAVRYEATLDLDQGGTQCNCTICMKLGATSSIVKPPAFRLLAGKEQLGEYRVGDSPNARYFCKRCGIHVYGQGDVPSIGGAFVSVSLNTLDEVELSALQTIYWDGRHDNWQAGPRNEPWPVRAA